MKKLLLILALLLSFSGFSHKFFISITDMEYDSTRNSINLSVKMIGHDFEQVLIRKFGYAITLEEVHDTSTVGIYIQQYLDYNLRITSADKRLKMNYVGKEIDVKDELFFYLSYSGVSDPASINISNKLLFSVSDQQQNIVHYKYQNQTKSVTLIPSKSEGQITFKEHHDD